MIRLKISLVPKRHCPVNLNYKYYLAGICNKIMNECDENFDEEKHASILTFSNFHCSKYEIKENKIIFKDAVSWYITTPVYEVMLHISQKLFNMEFIKVGGEELEVTGIEAAELQMHSSNLSESKGSRSYTQDWQIYDKLKDYYTHSEEKII